MLLSFKKIVLQVRHQDWEPSTDSRDRFSKAMDSQKTILTPFNFFEWKAEMEILLRAKGLYRVTMATEAEPNAAAEKIKWHNQRDEAYGLLCLSISRDLLFHLDGLTSPDQVWEKLSELFRKTDEMRGHQIENELISLSPSNFESLQLYFSSSKH